jgi:hypothetical protein
MLYSCGVLTVLDRGVTINWEDGPTLHKLTAQARYHTPESATSQLLRVGAGQRFSDDPLTFTASDGQLRAAWCWRDRGAGWSAQLSITNLSEADLFIDALEVVRIDSAFGGALNLGAPSGLWRCARENSAAELAWETWAESTASSWGFLRAAEMLIQPTVSNRTRPPVIAFLIAPDTAGIPTDLRLECTGEKFERLVARTRADGTLLGAGAALASAEVWIAAGDDARELREWPARERA